MAAEATPKSVSTDDNFRVWFVPSGSNPKSVAILTGATAKSITYSLTPAGFNRTTTEEMVSDERLSLKQVLQRFGTVSEELEVQYVYGDAGDVAAIALAEGVEGFIVSRYAVPNATDAATGQKVDVIPIKCGRQRKDQPVRNGVFTKTQKLAVTGVVENDATLVA